MSQGHHPDRMTNVPGDVMDWDTHQAVHEGEREALGDLGIRQDAFNTGFGNEINPDNLPPRRTYGND
ncbi:hypothetical protein HOM83_00135 [Candidatus Falkowbacteria bacterium]|nr:hypothetical protein [Candidatus Falkowbacteria bacterium]